jgi:Kef-type K+ transport system membrane component KefB
MTLSPASGVGPSAWLRANLRQNIEDPATRLFLEVILIILAARLCGELASGIGQPAVIGEMAAGILLGPSFLGWLWPTASEFIFTPASLGIGIPSPRLFTMLVLMALVTTGLTGPLLNLGEYLKNRAAASARLGCPGRPRESALR